MTLTYGFYNSVSSDRLYNALQMSQIFDGIIEDGVFASIGDSFIVSENSTPDMNLLVGSGRCWFNHTWTYNDASIIVIVPTADALLPRIDVIYLEVNEDTGVRANSVDILEGTPASSPVAPTLTNTTTVHQYPLAHIYVGAGVTSIIQDNVTNKVGTDDTPFVTGPLSVISTNDLLIQWEAEFGTWFDSIKDQLDGEAETLLQNQINAIVGDMNPPLIDLIELKSHDHTGGGGDPIPSAGIEGLAVTESKVATSAITNTKIGPLAVTGSKVGANEISYDKLGAALSYFKGRQGGNATNWDVAGTSTRTITGLVIVQVGVVYYTGPSYTTVTFPYAFSGVPIVFAMANDAAFPAVAKVEYIQTNLFRVELFNSSTLGYISGDVAWMAIGPE